MWPKTSLAFLVLAMLSACNGTPAPPPPKLDMSCDGSCHPGREMGIGDLGGNPDGFIPPPDLAVPPPDLTVAQTCKTSKDCTVAERPVCDGGICRACQEKTAKADCPDSELCSSPTSSVQPPYNAGACVAITDVAFVDKQAAGCGTGNGQKATPYCEIQTAINAAPRKPYIVVRPSATGLDYQALTITSGTAIVIGPGRDAAAKATTQGVEVKGAMAADTPTAILDGLLIRLGGANCDSAGASLTVRRSIVESATVGVKTTSCKQVTVDRSDIRLNTNEGIRLGSDTADYLIVNSLITDNASGGGSGVDFGLRTKGTFQFNTVSSNGVFEAAGGGITCEAVTTLVNSIVVLNQPIAGGTMGTQFSGSCQFQQVVVGSDTTMAANTVKITPDFAGIGDYRLKPKAMSANNGACCIDKAGAAGPIEYYYDTKRPLGAAYDVGFHEEE